MLGLPAELYPQIGQSARMQFIKLRNMGYVNGSFGLPAELYPHIWFAVRQLLYYTIVAEFVNRFLKIFLGASLAGRQEEFGKRRGCLAEPRRPSAVL